MWLHTKRYKKIIKSKGTNPNLFLFVINEVVVNSKEVAMNIIRELLMTGGGLGNFSQQLQVVG